MTSLTPLLGREGGREGWWEGEMGGREGGREGGRVRWEGGREGVREGGREGANVPKQALSPRELLNLLSDDINPSFIGSIKLQGHCAVVSRAVHLLGTG